MITYIPVFSGKTKDDKRVVLYRDANNEDEFHIQHPDGELFALSLGSEWVMWQEDDDRIHMAINSPEWSGTAVGTKHDSLYEEGLH